MQQYKYRPVSCKFCGSDIFFSGGIPINDGLKTRHTCDGYADYRSCKKLSREDISAKELSQYEARINEAV